MNRDIECIRELVTLLAARGMRIVPYKEHLEIEFKGNEQEIRGAITSYRTRSLSDTTWWVERVENIQLGRDPK